MRGYYRNHYTNNKNIAKYGNSSDCIKRKRNAPNRIENANNLFIPQERSDMSDFFNFLIINKFYLCFHSFSKFYDFFNNIYF